MNHSTLTHVAKLAQIQLPEDITVLENDISEILAFVDHLQNVDTKDIAPLTHPHEQTLQCRPDEAVANIDRENLQHAAPQCIDHCYVVPSPKFAST